MQIFADFHLHSKYSRATSRNISLQSLKEGSRIKGLNLLGAGDFTHPLWLNEIKSKLQEISGTGIYEYDGMKFLLTSEVCTIFDFENKTRKVHHLIHAPSFEIVEQINERLAKFGNLKSDGRPILNAPAPQVVEEVMQVSKDVFVYPAHCVLPNEVIMTNPSVKEIQNVKGGDMVFTHTGSVQKIEKVLSRPYAGTVLKIVPWYFSTGVEVTPEHPFFAIKTIKNCNGGGGICKPLGVHIRNCYRKYYKNYKPEWVNAENLEVGDVLLYPRVSKTLDINKLVTVSRDFPKRINVDSDFCKLVGYYLAEGYTNSRDGIGFSFNKTNEINFVSEVKKLILKIFGINAKKGKTKGDVMFYSKNLMGLFGSLFYVDNKKDASHKCLPQWMLFISKKKQSDIFKCWWRGDKGSTSSRLLHNQMKLICLRLGIIPCTRIDKVETHRKRGKHFIGKREIRAKSNNYILEHLSFFEDKFGLLDEAEFRNFNTKTDRRHGWADKKYIYTPLRKIKKRTYNGKVFNLEVDRDNSFLTESACVHNCWTPWFGVFGSKSGFNSMEECYQDQAKNIFALETGLSSDPAMNWRLSKLDKISFLSSSDAHSTNAWRLGREANVFEIDKLDYWKLHEVIREKNPKSFLFTIETDPNYGKYHFTGHKNCGINLHPKDAARLNNMCPKCKRKLTVGVLQRLEELADRPEGFVPNNAVPFKTLLPLYEIISYATGTNSLYSKSVLEVHDKLLSRFGTELKVVLEVPKEEIEKVAGEKIASAIITVREGKVRYVPGFDGEYGKPIFSEDATIRRTFVDQKTLSEFKK